MAIKQTKKKNKKLLASLAAVLAVITLLAGTFAWITSKDQVLNELDTKQITDGSVVIQEVFTPPESWDPGMKVPKQVNVVNTGEGTVLVRVSFEEILNLLTSGGEITTTNIFDEQDDGTPIPAGWIPVTTTISSYIANGWIALNTSDIDMTELDNPPAIGDDNGEVTILMKQDGNSFGYMAYCTITNGTTTTYQKVNLGETKTDSHWDTTDQEFIFDGLHLLGIDPEGSPADKNIKFNWYDGKTKTEQTWPGTHEYVSSSLSAAKPALSLTGSPAIVMASTLDDTNMLKMYFGTYSDGTDDLPAVTTDLTTAVDNKLWYYASDGYFYYMDKVKPGVFTKQLFSALELDSTAGVEHSLMEYKLGITCYAIQNTTAAITASGGTGWNVAEASLLTALHNLCEN